MAEFEGFEEPFSYFLFLASIFLNLIVMLNLLIAIISDTYTRVAATQVESAFKEKCAVISDCRDFPLFRLWTKTRKPCSFLFIAISEEIDAQRKTNIDVYDLYDELMNVKDILTEVSTKVVDMQENTSDESDSDDGGNSKGNSL